MKKIIIPGPYYTENIGDYGQLKVLLDGLRNEMDEPLKVINLTRHIDTDFDKEFDVCSIQNLEHENKELSLGRWFNGLNPNDNTDHLVRIRKEMETADLLIIPGPMLYDISFSFLRGPIPYYAIMTLLCKFFNVPMMIYGLSIFEHKTEIAKEVVRFIISNSQAVTVRELSSKNYLIKIGINEDMIKILPDPALGLTPLTNVELAKSFLIENEFDPRDKEIIIVSPRHFNWLWNEQESESFYALWTALCDRMIEHYSAHLIFVPQATYNVDTDITDDRVVNRRIYEKMKNKNSAFIIENRCTIEQLLGFYRISSFVVAMRRHALVFAASQETPFFALFPSGYPPVGDFADDVNIISVGCVIDDFNLNTIWERLHQAWLKRDRSKENIIKVTQDKRGQVKRYISIAKSLLYKQEIK